MAENKTKPTRTSVSKFLAKVENDRRREDSLVVCELMKEITGEPPVMWGESMVGFGRYAYQYDSGRRGENFVAGFSPRKASLVLYIMSGFKGHAELMKKLGKHKTGQSCLYINKLADVDLNVLRELVSRSVEHVPGTRREIGVLRNLAMGLVLGLLTVVFVLALPVSIQVPLIGVGLGAAGGAYVGFALTAASSREQLIEWIGVAVFALIGAIGIGMSVWALVGGWLLHALWDLRHHRGSRSSWVPERYPMFCLAFDLVLAALAAYLAMEMT